ncbi:hypothetical protein D6783_01630 [Candidatus Woesearchaeota archaeon]|nr:MAG: hypothetical protein D6783_01630 [Candidatus Woesearchaeota archaeon]
MRLMHANYFKDPEFVPFCRLFYLLHGVSWLVSWLVSSLACLRFLLSRFSRRGFPLFAVAALLVLFFVAGAAAPAAAVKITSLPLEQRTLLYEPGKTFTFELAVEDAPRISVYAQGALSENVVIDDPSPDGGPRKVTVHITHPPGLEPGQYKTFIAAAELPPEQTVQIAALATVRTGFITRVLGPEKAVKASLQVSSVNQGEPAEARVQVESWTLSHIVRLFAIINVTGPEGEAVGSFETDRVSLPATKSTTLTATIPTKDLKKGSYHASALLFYDGLSLPLSASFRVGELDVRVVNYTRVFRKGVINQLDIIVESDWKGNIGDVFAEVRVAGEVIRTPLITLQGFSRGVLTTYWNTRGLEVGEYPATIMLFYANKTSTSDVLFSVVEPPKEERAGGVFGVLASPLGVAYLVLFLLVLLNVYVLFFRKKKSG